MRECFLLSDHTSGFFYFDLFRVLFFYLSCFASCHLLIILQIAKTIYPITPPRVLSDISSTSKLPHSCYQLKALHKEAHSKTVEKGKKKATIPACHRHKKSKWYENQDISEQICIRYPSQNISIQPKSFYFTEKNQVIMIFPGSFPSIPVRKKSESKIKIQYTGQIKSSQEPEVFFCSLLST